MKFLRKIGKFSKSDAQARAVELFRKLDLPEPETIGDRFPHQVSGGQLQRCMTALALCPEPDLVVFDEPTTALDVTTQIDVLKAIKEAISDTGVAALYITHDLAVVAQVSDHIMVLRQGEMVEYGTADQIINAPVDEYTKALVSVRSIDHKEKTPSGEPLLRVQNITARYRGTKFDVLKDIKVLNFEKIEDLVFEKAIYEILGRTDKEQNSKFSTTLNMFKKAFKGKESHN